ncbi:hypothetical protein HY972_00210 [Candidatus Kaiserbacteria bacterium]|nr:hypothetical protein [Candidatus Kaiserbacteria bacterium]
MRTLDDIIPPSRRKETEPFGQLPPNDGRESSRLSSDRPPRFPYVTLITIVSVIAVSVGALFYFSSAKVEITPHTVSAAVQGSFTATKSSGDLPFEIITAQKIASQSVKGSGTKTVSSSASGTIVIYNTQSKAQQLVTNTRFATTAGLIFRIHSAITIPGGSTAKPGSIRVKVYADQPGSLYNVGQTSFTIPGFAGTPQATQVYARSTSAMTGGASGIIPIVDAPAQAQARSALVGALGPDLVASIGTQIPEGYTLLPGATTTTYQDLALEPSSTTGMVEVKEQGTITAIVFPTAALAKAVASSVSGLNYQGEPLTLSLSSGNSLMLKPGSDLTDTQASSFPFTLTGTASFVYSVDPTRIAAAVSGKTRSAAEVALTNYPEIKRAVIILRPFWRQTFPQDPAAISVTVDSGAY